jgi:hypothetical protein
LTDAIPAIRTTAQALLHAFPAIALVSLILWTFALTAAFSFALMLDLELIGLGLCIIVFGAPSVWANWHVVRLAVDAERQVA